VAFPELRVHRNQSQLEIGKLKNYATYSLDPRGNVSSWNNQATLLHGYRADEIIGKQFSCLYTAEAVKRGHPDYDIAEASHNGALESESWQICKDGTPFWAKTVLTAMYSSNGKLIGFSRSIFLNEQKNSESQLDDSIKELRDIKYALDQSTIVAFTDKQGIITYVNDAFCKISKYSQGELLEPIR
jgi:PAS domain S-box-containing protein